MRIYSGYIKDRPVTMYDDGLTRYASYQVNDSIVWMIRNKFGKWRLYSVTKDESWGPWDES